MQLLDFSDLYNNFDESITEINCGMKCAPFNEYGKPFCCDTRHAVPTVYKSEWIYLQEHTDLWHPWSTENELEANRLIGQTPANQVLVECKGHQFCQRQFRSITCRAFPFFPYISKEGLFLGLTYYWEYENRCWVISNLSQVTNGYREIFMAFYKNLFKLAPQEYENYRHHSIVTRRVFGRKHRAIILLHENGGFYKVTPKNGRLRRISSNELPKFEPYSITDRLRFSDE